MRLVISIISTSISLLASAAALSHHSFSAEFDVGRPVNLVGTVKEMEWTNPHTWIHMEVKDEQGNTQEWAVEMLGTNSLIRSGMSPKTVKSGDPLTITGFGARNGTNTANASSVARTDSGESLWTNVRE
ncbi:MAG: hypothetical protein RLZZ227_1258 [Pseudomonadota bacterium]